VARAGLFQWFGLVGDFPADEVANRDVPAFLELERAEDACLHRPSRCAVSELSALRVHRRTMQQGRRGTFSERKRRQRLRLMNRSPVPPPGLQTLSSKSCGPAEHASDLRADRTGHAPSPGTTCGSGSGPGMEEG
jgi:hypothetical protein